MATVSPFQFDSLSGQPLGSAFPQKVKNNGTNSPVPGLAFDAATDEAWFWRFKLTQYGSGNLTLDIQWYADTATSGNVVWEAQIGAITPGDTQDIETDALATATNVTDAAGAGSQDLQEATITISNLDSVANGDNVVLRIARDADNASDTMAGDAILVLADLSYDDGT